MATEPIVDQHDNKEDVRLIQMESQQPSAGNPSSSQSTRRQHIKSAEDEEQEVIVNGNDIEVETETDSDNESEPLQLERQNTEERHFLYLDQLEVERYIRLFCSFVFIGGSIVIFYIFRDRSPYHNVAFCMALVQILWLIQFLGVVFTIHHLHSIVVFRKVVPDTIFLVVPYAVKEYKNHIMSSISAMSSMRGSNLFNLLGQSSAMCFGMTFAVTGFKWNEYQEINWDSTALGLLLISQFGSHVITGWELDLSSKLSTALHYAGALVSFVAAPTGFAMYQDWSALSVIIMIITYVCLAVFGSVYQFAKPVYDDDPGMVHKVSMFCIIVELIAVVNGMLVVILFIYCMDGDTIL